jgi:hypothetical protein
MAKRKPRKKAQAGKPATRQLYTLEVLLIGGPVSEAFAKQNPKVSRTIQIRGKQTLEDLHEAIFDAFDREDEHMYEFQFGKGPDDPRGKRYVIPFALEGPFATEDHAGVVADTTLGSLGLEVGQSFFYWFDFGDDWWHQIDVKAIDDEVPPGDYPHVTSRVGESPPQYPDWEEEADEDDEDEE